jgi:hypothetical protein
MSTRKRIGRGSRLVSQQHCRCAWRRRRERCDRDPRRRGCGSGVSGAAGVLQRRARLCCTAGRLRAAPPRLLCSAASTLRPAAGGLRPASWSRLLRCSAPLPPRPAPLVLRRPCRETAWPAALKQKCYSRCCSSVTVPAVNCGWGGPRHKAAQSVIRLVSCTQNKAGRLVFPPCTIRDE